MRYGHRLREDPHSHGTDARQGEEDGDRFVRIDPVCWSGGEQEQYSKNDHSGVEYGSRGLPPHPQIADHIERNAVAWIDELGDHHSKDENDSREQKQQTGRCSVIHTLPKKVRRIKAFLFISFQRASDRSWTRPACTGPQPLFFPPLLYPRPCRASTGPHLLERSACNSPFSPEKGP